MKRGFSYEFKKQLKMGITAAVGFMIAFAWKDPLFNYVNNLVLKITSFPLLSYSNQLITALLITFFGVLIIWILSKIVK